MFRAILFFIVVLVISLIYNLPMQWLYQYIKSDQDPIVLTNIQGSVWSGNASVYTTQLIPRYNADNWQWDFKALALFKGQLDWNIKQESQNIALDMGTDILSLGQHIHFELLSNISTLSAINSSLGLISGNLSAVGILVDLTTCEKGTNAGEIRFKNTNALGIKVQQIDVAIHCANPASFELNFRSTDPHTQLKGKVVIDRQGHFQGSTAASSSNQQIAEKLANISSKTLSKDRYLLEVSGNIN